MQYIEVNKHLDITPDDLYAIAVDIQQGKASWSFPIEWRITTVSEDIDDTIWERDQLKQEVEDHEDTISDLRDKITDLEEDIKSRDETIENLKSQIQELTYDK